MSAWFEAHAKRVAAACVLFFFAVLALDHKKYGLTDDDDFYVPAGISYFGWLRRVSSFDGAAFTRRVIDQAFEPNHEHPPLAKYVYGVCHALFGGWLGPTDGARVGAVLFATLIAALLFALALRHLGPRRGLFVGVVATALLLTMPRFHFHAHAATLDVPVAATYLACVTAMLWAERSRRAGIWAGVVFGLASATKLNGPFSLIGYLVFIGLVRRFRGGAGALGLTLPNVPVALISMVVLGPLTFFVLWPWMWFDVSQRVASYVSFHLHHYGIYFLYFGTLFNKSPVAPWHAPFVMAASTIPMATSVLALIGLGAAAPVVRRRLVDRSGPDDDLRREGDLLLMVAIHALLSIAIVAFSGGPKYGGEKLFMPFFPLWCLLAGYGALAIFDRVAAHSRGAWLAGGTTALAIAASAALWLRFGEYALSQYNALVGGLRGATALGFERQYYDVAHRDLVAWLNENAPKNARVHFLPNNWEYVRTYNWYRRAGDLRADIQVVNAEGAAEVVVVTHERRFPRYGDDLRRWVGRPVLRERIVDGTPIWTAYSARPAGPAR